MKKIILAMMIILFVGVCWSGYKLFVFKHLHDKLTQETKAAMVTGMMDVQNQLTTGLEAIGKANTTDINIGVEKVLTSTRILKADYDKANHETDVLNSIWWTFDSLQRFLKQTMQFYEDNQPFTLTTCKNVQIKNDNEILNELQNYKNVIQVPRLKKSTETTEDIWKNIIDHWDIAQASKIYRCDLRGE